MPYRREEQALRNKIDELVLYYRKNRDAIKELPDFSGDKVYVEKCWVIFRVLRELRK